MAFFLDIFICKYTRCSKLEDKVFFTLENGKKK